MNVIKMIRWNAEYERLSKRMETLDKEELLDELIMLYGLEHQAVQTFAMLMDDVDLHTLQMTVVGNYISPMVET